MHGEHCGKNEGSNAESNTINTIIKTFPIKIKILLAYLEKILYLWAVGECGGKEKNSLLERDEHRTPTLRNTAEKTGHLCWMTSNPMNDVLNRLIVGAKEESLVALVDDGGFVKVESRLVVNGNPPEFFNLVAEVLAVEEINHPLHAHKTALQQEELTPLFVVQLHNVKRGSCGCVISESDG